MSLRKSIDTLSTAIDELVINNNKAEERLAWYRMYTEEQKQLHLNNHQICKLKVDIKFGYCQPASIIESQIT